ncbi:hypothetical protein PROFUN_10680 [Planoprotostelium fungivorum]|uniref:F-box domain-containing protein n=1 Tax=Planoprotostelium fungivorum TaxID=1890364 RepID=A0A2P6MUW2_9EUKA|nr:hypothetical protein PROFUN_10680 [Planoprotostelium fungivorum]
MELLQLLTVTNLTDLLNGVDVCRLGRVSRSFHQLVTQNEDFDRRVWKTLCTRHELKFKYSPRRPTEPKRGSRSQRTKDFESLTELKQLERKTKHPMACRGNIKLLETKNNAWVYEDCREITYRELYLRYARSFETFPLERALRKVVAALESRGVDLVNGSEEEQDEDAEEQDEDAEEQDEDEERESKPVKIVLDTNCIDVFIKRYPVLRRYLPLPDPSHKLYYQYADDDDAEGTCVEPCKYLGLTYVWCDSGCSAEFEMSIDKLGHIWNHYSVDSEHYECGWMFASPSYDTMLLDYADWIDVTDKDYHFGQFGISLLLQDGDKEHTLFESRYDKYEE